MEYELIIGLRAEHFEAHGMRTRGDVFAAHLHFPEIPKSFDGVDLILRFEVVDLAVSFHILHLPDLGGALFSRAVFALFLIA